MRVKRNPKKKKISKRTLESWGRNRFYTSLNSKPKKYHCAEDIYSQKHKQKGKNSVSKEKTAVVKSPAERT